MKTVWYFPLESVKSRYTDQLCNEWIPNAFEGRCNFITVRGEQTESDIKVGRVLDATGRGIYALTQCAQFLRSIAQGKVKSGDAFYIQDFWTPGLEAIAYACSMYGIELEWYNMLHAQSVDEFDFTYKMLPWIRNFELGYDSLMKGTFVASSIHRDQLIKAGWKSPIHVVGLPIDVEAVVNYMKPMKAINQVIYCSRLDEEKNPMFMLGVAERFLNEFTDWTWVVTTSANEFRSNQPEVLEKIFEMNRQNSRFFLFSGLSKNTYYATLQASRILFNSSKQDYVSWTLLEGSIFGCDICFPNFRSFPECVPEERLYRAFDVDDALRVLRNCIMNPEDHTRIAEIADSGRHAIADIVLGEFDPYPAIVNVWEEEYEHR